jgi:RimJ/RimL family protein N-acetyltransferase
LPTSAEVLFFSQIEMNTPKQIITQRLTMIAATLEHIITELESPAQLSPLLDAEVSSAWPPGEYDRDAMEFFRARFEEGGKEVEGWYGWYAVRAADGQSPRALIGAGGYLGPPSPEGMVEIGYSVLPEWRRMGYATEIAEALVAHASSLAYVTNIIAHTAESNAASIGVLKRCGFEAAGTGAEAGTLRFELIPTPRTSR